MNARPIESGWGELGAATKRYLERLPGSLPAGEGEDFEARYLGWELSRCAVGLSRTEQRALAAIGAACVSSVMAGSTRLPVSGRAFDAALQAVGAEVESRVAQELLVRARDGADFDPVRLVIGRPGERKPLIVQGPWVSTERMHLLESRFCERVRARVASALSPPSAHALRKATSAIFPRSAPLTEEQRTAVREGMRAPLALITGGPGTGKTTTVVALVRALAWTGVKTEAIALSAPTGKAAQRLSDALAEALAAAPPGISEAALRAHPPPPVTLHRLLGWSPQAGRFARHENDPLPHGVVIVDEASMIDLAMMDRLLRALRPGARLVLVGDADQLPSVEAGAVFRDLCSALGAARLTENLRVARDASARAIVSTATAINAGTVGTAMALRHSVRELVFEGVEHLDASFADVGDELLEAILSQRQAGGEPETLYGRTYRMRGGVFKEEDAAALARLFAHHGTSRFLCATRVQGYPACAEGVNASLVARMLRKGFAAGLRRGDVSLGAPVVVQRNDYLRRLFNGDQGVIVRVDPGDAEGPRVMSVFPRAGGTYEALPMDAAVDLAPAFALTVHKAQGSEFDRLVLVLPDDDVPMLTRELVYTAVTRARRSVLIVGRVPLLVRAVARATERHTGVAESLRKRA